MTGRPKKQPHEQRTSRLPAIRLTDAERQLLEEKAAQSGLSFSEWVRAELTAAPVRASKADPALPRLLTELNRVGVNLNQLAASMNSGRHPAENAVLAHLKQLQDVLLKVARRGA